MQTPPQIEKTISDASWLLEQFAKLQQVVQCGSAKNAFMDEAFRPWVIANRVCDKHDIPKIRWCAAHGVQH